MNYNELFKDLKIGDTFISPYMSGHYRKIFPIQTGYNAIYMESPNSKPIFQYTLSYNFVAKVDNGPTTNNF